MTVEVERKLVRWGSGFGIRLTAEEVAKLGLRAGAVVHAEVGVAASVKNDFSAMPRLRFPAGPVDLDAIVEEEVYRDYLRGLPNRRPALRSKGKAKR